MCLTLKRYKTEKTIIIQVDRTYQGEEREGQTDGFDKATAPHCGGALSFAEIQQGGVIVCPSLVILLLHHCVVRVGNPPTRSKGQGQCQGTLNIHYSMDSRVVLYIKSLTSYPTFPLIVLE